MVGELLGDLMDRGLDFSQPPLYVLDGGKALSTAVKKHGGESAPLQRCQVHKRRNVLSQFFHGEPGVWDNAPDRRGTSHVGDGGFAQRAFVAVGEVDHQQVEKAVRRRSVSSSA